MTIRVPNELLVRDPAVLAPQAGLVYLPDDEPGVTRRRRGSGFTYVDAFGATVTGPARARIEAIAIPPAWDSVWISPDPTGYLQAAGVDDAGRKQYRYHDEFRAFCDARKFARLPYFRRAVVKLRAATDVALDEPLGTRAHAVAAAVRLIDTCLLRVGNHQSAANGHYGATTLTVDHVIDHGHLTLDYVGKSGKTHSVVVEDDDLSDILVELAHDADNELFWFDDPEAGERRRAEATDINRFIVHHAGGAFSAKDFRTWGGSAIALQGRAEGERPLEAIDHAAHELGNTRSVARSSYIHPSVLAADDDTIAEIWRTSRSSKWLSRSENALGKLIDD
ncbi:MAG: DNA topoisomerase IB [Ilumatobacteraceae bacterium]